MDFIINPKSSFRQQQNTYYIAFRLYNMKTFIIHFKNFNLDLYKYFFFYHGKRSLSEDIVP